MPRGRRRAATVLGAFATAEALTVAFGGAAWATTVSSTTAQFTVNGVVYQTRASLVVNSYPEGGVAGGLTNLNPTYSALPAGWAGLYCRLFKNNALAAQAGWQNNTGPIGPYNNFNIDCFPEGWQPAASWYSQGQTRHWTGTGYTYYNTYPTPSLNT